MTLLLSFWYAAIYGHRMNNGSMFGFLKYYREPEYLEAHPLIYVAGRDGTVYQYEVFAAYEAKLNADTYRVQIKKEEHKQAFLTSCLAKNTVETGIVPTVEDRILTLSTCTGRGHATRWIVQARLSAESPAACYKDLY